MLLSKPIRPGVSLIYSATSWQLVGAGAFSIAFSLVMLLHPDGWKSGVQTADPNTIRAIGVAIGLFGLAMAFGRTSFLVNRTHGLLTKQISLFVTLSSTTYNLADFTSVAVEFINDSESKAKYALRLVGPNQTLTLTSGRTKDAVRRSKKAVMQSTGLPSHIERDNDD